MLLYRDSALLVTPLSPGVTQHYCLKSCFLGVGFSRSHWVACFLRRDTFEHVCVVFASFPVPLNKALSLFCPLCTFTMNNVYTPAHSQVGLASVEGLRPSLTSPGRFCVEQLLRRPMDMCQGDGRAPSRAEGGNQGTKGMCLRSSASKEVKGNMENEKNVPDRRNTTHRVLFIQ